jgi:hypothetical protein
MAPTVDDRRDQIREAVGRHSRVESTAFTKEALAAICEATGDPVDAGRLPPKSEMRARILRAIDPEGTADPSALERPFRKAELESIAAALDGE